ncbi:MAG TPA: NlpC/P60 family protein, partial [Hyphomicrobiaceae bacterium]|nr:NlpC/P60 family protein [Hyphomicrobiaceae bacterium]
IGVDCSGLVQLALEAAGLKAPRDSDMQQAALGENVLIPADLDGLKRGDLVFWPGHVAVMTDGMMLLHANAHHMSAVSEPLTDAVTRIARAGSTISAIKRLPALSAKGAA